MGSTSTRLDALPVSNPSTSYWQANAKDSPIHDHGKDDLLPSPNTKIDVVIIGSGISGAVAAYELQKQAPHLSIVMLEARQACSGATGRNGGHCRPDSFLGFEGYSAIVGKEQAHQVLLNEWDTYSYIRDTIGKEKIQCDWWEGTTLSVCLNEKSMQKAKRNYESYKANTSLRPGVLFVDDASEARKLSRVTKARGAAVFPAGSLYPLRFVHSLLAICLSRGNFQLFTHTPVQALIKEDAGWKLQTSKGFITTSKVLLATNGYSRALLPSLDDFLVSHRAHCSSIIPSSNFKGQDGLRSTCSIVREAHDYEYLIQRPPDSRSDNAFILGGGNTQIDKSKEIDTHDDSYVNTALAAYFTSYAEETFEDWGRGDGKLSHLWSGIQGYTRDSLPIVGESFEQEGLYLCLGHHGHGMARAATCAKGVASLIASSKSDDVDDDCWQSVTELPLCYRWTSTRAERRDVDHRADF